jgi:hypothetical protein
VDLLARLVVDDAERYKLPRILIPRTRVNKGIRKGRGCLNPPGPYADDEDVD